MTTEEEHRALLRAEVIRYALEWASHADSRSWELACNTPAMRLYTACRKLEPYAPTS